MLLGPVIPKCSAPHGKGNLPARMQPPTGLRGTDERYSSQSSTGSQFEGAQSTVVGKTQQQESKVSAGAQGELKLPCLLPPGLGLEMGLER